MTLSTALRLLNTYVKEWEWSVLPQGKTNAPMVCARGVCPFTSHPIHIKAMGVMGLVKAVTDTLILSSARRGRGRPDTLLHLG